MDIREKIKKLLALAQSPNEHEAQAALLKAKELMMANKLTEADFTDKTANMVHIVAEEIQWTTDSGDSWMASLGKIIGDNYLCAIAWRTPYKTRTHIAVITGMEDDVQICRSALEYAAGFVRNQIKVQQRKSRLRPETVRDSYANGFITGLDIAFEIQNSEKSQEWGLVALKPEQVKNYEESLKEKKVRVRKGDFDPLAYMRGQKDGMEFNNKKVLGGATTCK